MVDAGGGVCRRKRLRTTDLEPMRDIDFEHVIDFHGEIDIIVVEFEPMLQWRAHRNVTELTRTTN